MKPDLTVVCVWVAGEYPYTPEYVVRLEAMVRRWIDRPFRFVCLTDRPWTFEAPIEPVRVAKLAGFAPWTKLELFNPLRAWPGRVLYLDLDSLIVAPLAPILDVPAHFAITADTAGAHKPRTLDAYGRRIVRRFNSSVMVWDGGTQGDLYTDWTPAASARLSGDQDWIGERRAGAATLPRAWFPRLSELLKRDSGDGPPPFGDAKVVLVKVPKNALAAAAYPWFAGLWGAA